MMSNFKMVRRFFLLCIFLLGTGVELSAQFNKPNASAYNPFDDRYYITNHNGQSVVKMDRFGNKSYFIQNLIAPNNIIFDVFPFGPAFIVLDSNKARVFDTSGSMLADISVPNALNLRDLVYDSAAKCIYTTDVDKGFVYKTTFGAAPNFTPYISLWVSGIARPSNLLLQKSQNRLLLVQDTLNSDLLSIDLTSKAVSVLRNTGLSNLSGLAQDAEGNYYISSQFEKNIYQWNKYLTGYPKRIVGEPKPGDITVNSAKDEWVYCCILCGSVYVAKLHTFGPAIELMGCPGDSVDVYKNTLIKCLGTFNAGNEFILEISSPWGNFDSAMTILSVVDTLQPIYQRIQIPDNLVGSKKYRYRYRTTNPAVNGMFELVYVSEKPKEQFVTDSIPFCGYGDEFLVPKDTQFVYQYWSNKDGFADSSKMIYPFSKKREVVYLKTQNGDGCISEDTVIAYPIISEKVKLALKSDSILYASNIPQNARYFVWRCNDTLLMDTTKEIVVKKTGFYTLSFVLKATNDCDYFTDSLYVQYVPKEKSTVENLNAFNVNIFPVPLESTLNFTSNKLIKELHIYNAIGKEIRRININQYGSFIDCSKFENGVYVFYFQCADGDGFLTKLVK